MAAVQPGPAAPGRGRALALTGAAAAVGFGLFAAAIGARWGTREYAYVGDRFFFVRRLILAAAGMAGLCAWAARLPWRMGPWGGGRLSRGWVQLCCGYGLLVGWLSPLQHVRGAPRVVLGLAALHVACEELFFRAALTPALVCLATSRTLGILLSGIAYGAYHCTYASFWLDAGWQVRLYYCGLIAGFAGVPYAWLQVSTRTWLAPLLCHLVVQLTMMARSLWPPWLLGR